MLKIIPVQDKGEQERICGRCGTEYLPDSLAYAGYEDDMLACIAQFSIKSGYVELYNLSAVTGAPENGDAMLLCGRAALNFAYTIGILQARCDMPDESHLPLYKAVGFTPDGARMTCDLKKLFESHCH
jgi:hypothetical protein